MAIDFLEAQTKILDAIKAVNSTQIVDTTQALNKVLAKDIITTKPLPPFNNSAMDGYAFRYEDINNPLKVVKEVFAGDIQEPILKQNECYKITTGAKIPDDANIVAPKEICEIKNSQVIVKKPIPKGNAIRLKGEELQKNSTLLKKGELLTPAKIASLASQGITKIDTFKELKIAILSTGNELKEPHQKADEFELYNINAINIAMHLKQFGFNSNYIGVVPDNLQEATKIVATLKDYDIIISSGGVSVGEADFTKKALLNNGFRELFHGVRVKPGHPVMSGFLDKTFVIALPGNPLAAILNLLLLFFPAIFKMQGAKEIFFNPITAKMSKDLKLKPNRVNIVLGEYKDGYFSAYKDNRYGSGMISPLVNSNAVALFNQNIEYINKDSTIKVVLLNSLNLIEENSYLNS